MAKWQDAPVVEKPNWMAAPVVRPDPVIEERKVQNIARMAHDVPRDVKWEITDEGNIEVEGNDYEQGVWGKIKESFGRGKQQALTDVAITESLYTGDPKTVARAIDVKDRVLKNEAQHPLGASWFSDFIYSNVRTSGQVWESIKAGGKGAAVVGGAGAVAGGVVGGLIPTIGEEPATITGGAAIGLKAGAKLGLAEGAAIFSYRQGMGEMYYEMIKNDADPEVAQTVSGIAAIPYALIEIAQLKALSPQVKKAMAKKLQLSLTKIVLEAGKKHGKVLSIEVAEEMAQKAVSITARDVAAVASENDIEIDAKLLKEHIIEILEEGKGALKSMALIPLPGTAIEAGIHIAAAKGIKLAPEEVTTKTEGKTGPPVVAPIAADAKRRPAKAITPAEAPKAPVVVPEGANLESMSGFELRKMARKAGIKAAQSKEDLVKALQAVAPEGAEGVSPALQRVHDSKVRAEGLAASPERSVKAWLKQIRALAVKNGRQDIIDLVDTGEAEYFAENYSDATQRLESALGHLHQDEIAEMKDIVKGLDKLAEFEAITPPEAPQGPAVAPEGAEAKQTQPYPAFEGDKRVTKQGPASAPVEDITLFDELNNNATDFNKPRISKLRKSEIIERSKEIRRELGRKGYEPDFIKAVEMNDAGIPLPTPLSPEGAEGSGGIAWQTAVRNWITQSKELRPLVEEEQHEGRQRQAAGYQGTLKWLTKKGVKAEEALRRATGALRGQLTDYRRFRPMDEVVSREFLDEAYKDIRDTDRLQPFERIGTEKAFTKMREGYVLAPHEIEFLKKWRPELADVFEKRLKRQPVIARIMSQLEQILGLLKFSAAFDVQMRRQARWLRARFPKTYAQAIGKNLEGYVSQKRADKMAREVKTDKQHEIAKSHGLQFLKRNPPKGERPEQYISYLGERIPIVGRFYKASMRGFVDSFNWTQQQLWNYFTNKWQAEGKEVTHRDLDELAEFCNTFLGMQPAQTNFGKAARRVLAPVMWSPTLTWSRVRSPEMILTNKAMRFETAKTLGSYIGSGVMMMMTASILARLLKKDDPIEWDPRSSDFGKIKIGNTRVDVYGDGGPYIRAFMQVMMQGKKNQAGRIRRDVGIEPIKQLLRNKRAPFIDMVGMIWTQRNYYGGPAYALPDWAEIKEKGGIRQVVAKAGEKITESTTGEIGFFVTRDLIARPFVPFFVQGTVEASWIDGWPIAMWAGTEEFFSGSTLSYEPSNYSKMQVLQDQVAEEKHDKLWEDLTPRQQEKIRRDTPEIDEYEEKAAFERMPREEVSLSEQNKTAKQIAKAMPLVVRKELDNNRVRITGLSRSLGDFWLNDSRYEAYQKEVTDEVEARLTKLVGTKRWEKLEREQRAKLMRGTIIDAKKRARNTLTRKMEKGEL